MFKLLKQKIMCYLHVFKYENYFLQLSLEFTNVRKLKENLISGLNFRI